MAIQPTFTPSRLPAVDVDPQLLLHIHRNAVSNAVKYGRPGGTVETRIGLHEHTLTLRVVNEAGAGHDALHVLQTSHRRAVDAQDDEAFADALLCPCAVSKVGDHDTAAQLEVLSNLLGDGAKYMRDSRFASALGKMARRAKEIDSRGNTRRSATVA